MTNKKILIVSLETIAVVAVRIIQVLSFNATGMITAAWTTPVLYALAIAACITVFLPIDGREGNSLTENCITTDGIISVGGGISAVAIGVLLIINGIVQYQEHPSTRFALPTLVMACASGLSFVFIIGVVNFFRRRDLYGKGVMGIPAVFVFWLGFALIDVFFVDKTMQLGHLNAFSVLTYSAYLFFFLAYIKEFCGFGEKKTRRSLVRFAFLSSMFALANFATKIVYNYIPMGGAVAEPYSFSFAGALLDFALFAFAICVIFKAYTLPPAKNIEE